MHVWSGGLRLSQVTGLWPDLTLLEAEPLESADNPTAAEVRLVVEVARGTLDPVEQFGGGISAELKGLYCTR